MHGAQVPAEALKSDMFGDDVAVRRRLCVMTWQFAGVRCRADVAGAEVAGKGLAQRAWRCKCDWLNHDQAISVCAR